MSLSVYEAFLLANSNRIFSIESSARSLTWILPGRFQDSDLVSEGLYSALEVLGLYHDTILQRAIKSIPPHLQPKPSSHSRYTNHFTSTSPTYAFLSRSLTILTYSELLLEMTFKKKLSSSSSSSSSMGGDKLIISIESLKVLLRLALMRTTKGRTGVTPPVPEREIDSNLLEKYEASSRNNRIEGNAQRRYQNSLAVGGGGGVNLPRSAADVLFVGAGSREERGEGGTTSDSQTLTGEEEDNVTYGNLQESNEEYWTGKRSGITRPTISSIRGGGVVGEITSNTKEVRELVNEYLISKVLTVEDVKRPEDLINQARGLGKIAEIIWILRPLIYVLAMRKYGKRHTFPYLLSLAIEYLAFSLRRTAANRLALNKSTGSMLPHTISEAEKAETKRRAMAFWLYVVRGPVWETFTKPQLQSVATRFEDKPLIGFVSTLIKDYLPLVDEYYFYTSR